jgi:hypothetical protein
MRIRLGLIVALALAFSTIAPATALADSGSNTYMVEMEAPNFAQAPNGDEVAVTGEGEFGIRPNFVEAEGEFTHSFAGGGSISGTWRATQLLAFHSYGCGVIFGDPTLPDNLCGGILKLGVTLTAGSTSLNGILTIYCLIGDHVPASAEEGIKLVVPGVINFNDTTGGENVYIKTTGG